MPGKKKGKKAKAEEEAGEAKKGPYPDAEAIMEGLEIEDLRRRATQLCVGGGGCGGRLGVNAVPCGP